MYVALFLFDDLKIAVLEHDTPVLWEGDRPFTDISEDWAQSLFLGFYDWLRAPNSSEIVGIDLVLHDECEAVRYAIPAHPYIEWLAAGFLRIRFSDRAIDEDASIDQEFSISRCLVADDGSVALLFDASSLAPWQLQRWRLGAYRDLDLDPDGSMSMIESLKWVRMPEVVIKYRG